MQLFLLVTVAAASLSLRNAQPGGKLREVMQENLRESMKSPKVLDRLEEDCSDAECDAITVKICEKLWEKKLEECEANAKRWAGICPAPKFRDSSGKQRDCKKGCCSELGQVVIEDGPKKLPRDLFKLPK